MKANYVFMQDKSGLWHHLSKTVKNLECLYFLILEDSLEVSSFVLRVLITFYIVFYNLTNHGYYCLLCVVFPTRLIRSSDVSSHSHLDK